MPVSGQVRAGAQGYRALLGLREARWPLVASIAGSMPIGMFGLAILLLVPDAHGSFGVAGRVVGAFGVANALGAVAQGRVMDRYGQPAVLRRVAPVHVLMLVALVIAAGRGAPSWVLGLCALGAGACIPQIPAAMRSLWSALVEDEDSRQTAYALVTMAFEVSVVAAPVLVALVAAVASPAAAVLTAAVIGASGGIGFSLTAASRRWRGVPHAVGPLVPLHASGVRTLSSSCSPSGPRSASSRWRCRRSPRAAARPRRAASPSRRSRPGACVAGSSTGRGAGRDRRRSASPSACSPSRPDACSSPATVPVTVAAAALAVGSCSPPRPSSAPRCSTRPPRPGPSPRRSRRP